MNSVVACIGHDHDARLLLAAAAICVLGVYTAFALAMHAARSDQPARRIWRAISVAAAGCTAWATHFVALLAFRPGQAAAYDPLLTAASLLVALFGIGAGTALAFRVRLLHRRVGAGAAIGVSIAALHYLGQSAYLLQGRVSWDLPLVLISAIVGVGLASLGVAAGGARRRWRRFGPPSLLLSIAVIHFGGMAAMSVHEDRALRLPAGAIPEESIAPVVALICTGLIALGAIGLWFDMAARLRARRDGQRLKELAEVALEGLLLCSDGVVVAANGSAAHLIGISEGKLAGTPIDTLLPGLDVEFLPEREEREAELMDAGGRPVPVRVLRREITLGHRRQTVIALRDQRERLRTEQRMRMLAYSDPLTGLCNRTRFYELLAAETALLQVDKPFSVLMIDLDRFKPINDRFGHACGDAVLRTVGERLTSSVGDADTVARLGGDEFVLLLPGSGADDAERLARKILDAVNQAPFLVDRNEVRLGTSIGIATAPGHGSAPSIILHSADIALYAAKAASRGTFRHYHPALDERFDEVQKIEEGLRAAIHGDLLELHYQPIVRGRTGEVVAAEALVRWRDPERGLVPPVDFISVAEETGLIHELGEWVLRTACLEAARWPGYISVAVNLSPVQFRRPGLVRLVRAALENAGLSPDRLELEITEGVLLANERSTLTMLRQLRRIGVRLAMDDFGTGYSSLGYLRRFSFDKIKLDQSFVRKLPDDQESATIVRAVAVLGQGLGLTVVVEGVETQEQLAFAVSEGCNLAQGYLISRPLTADRFRNYLGSRTTAIAC